MHSFTGTHGLRPTTIFFELDESRHRWMGTSATTETSLVLVGENLAEQESDTQTIEVRAPIPHDCRLADAVAEL